MLVHLCLLAFVISAVQEGLCLKCYSCLSSYPRDSCERLDKSKIPLKTCDTKELEQTERFAKEIDQKMGRLYEVHAAQEPLVPLNCLKQVIKHGEKHYTLRGCQLGTFDQLDICLRVRNENQDLIKTEYCSLCNGDGCNSAFSTRPIMSFISSIVLAVALFCFSY